MYSRVGGGGVALWLAGGGVLVALWLAGGGVLVALWSASGGVLVASYPNYGKLTLTRPILSGQVIYSGSNSGRRQHSRNCLMEYEEEKGCTLVVKQVLN